MKYKSEKVDLCAQYKFNLLEISLGIWNDRYWNNFNLVIIFFNNDITVDVSLSTLEQQKFPLMRLEVKEIKKERKIINYTI